MNNLGFELPNSEHLLLSGGADGADYQFSKYAHLAGHGVVNWAFDGHRSKVPPQHLVKLSDELLSKADPHLVIANKSLKRKFPSKNKFVNDLLRRNFYQVKWTGSVYAISTFDSDGLVSGGTSWAVQMYMDRFLVHMEPFDLCRLYFYDQALCKWFKWIGINGWSSIDNPPIPTGIYTGIGTRELQNHSIEEIKKLYSQFSGTPR